MNNTFERIISYIIGAIAGYAVGSFLVSAHMDVIDPMCRDVVMQITPLVGLLLAMIIVEYRNERMMRKNNTIRDETVALITHEMRTSLTSTGWAIGMVLKKYDGSVTPEDKTLLQGVVNSIHTTVMHSVNLLDVSLLDIGKLSISLEWVALDKVEYMIKEMLEKYALGTAQHGIHLTHEMSFTKGKMVEVDMLRLRIVLENLLENAIQYTSEDNQRPEKSIHVQIANDDKDLHISIKDNGIGIPDSEKEKIFSEFYRASNARKKLSTGSGIGLYTCSNYIKAHRGRIWFESKEQEGTTFFISIPLKTEADVKGFLKQI